jgi:hypothetical protein
LANPFIRFAPWLASGPRRRLLLSALAPWRFKRTDWALRTRATAALNAVFDAVLGLASAIVGVAALTVWYICSAAYYLALCGVRAYLLRQPFAAGAAGGPFGAGERHVYRRSGQLLAATGAAYVAVSVATVLTGKGPVHTGLAAYAITIAAFVKFSCAIGGLLAARRFGGPVYIALKTANLADALVSLGVVQYALMSVIGGPDPVGVAGRVGLGLGAVITVVGVAMAVKTTLPDSEDDPAALTKA